MTNRKFFNILNILLALAILTILLFTIVWIDPLQERYITINNIVPLVGLKFLMQRSDIVDFTKHIAFYTVIYVPFGFIYAWKKYPTLSVRKIVFRGFILSGCIEFLQTFFPNLYTNDVDEILLNTLGTLIGCMIWKVTYKKNPIKFNNTTSAFENKQHPPAK